MTRRQKLCSLLIGYLGNISIANGYKTNAGADVQHWGTQIIPRDKTSAMWINLKDTTNEREMGLKEVLTLDFELGCKSSTNHTTITNMIFDINKCMEDNEKALETAMSDNGMRLIYSNEEVMIEREGDAEFGRATVTFNLHHRYTEKWELDEGSY